MKTITIYSRKVLERTRFRDYRYKEVKQVTILYDGQEFRNHSEKLDNPRLKTKFNIELQTRSKKGLDAYIDKLGRSNADKWTKNLITRLMDGTPLTHLERLEFGNI